MTEHDIREALRVCFDPELRVNIVDAGMLYEVAVASDPDAPGSGIAGVPPRFRIQVKLLKRSLDEDRNALLLEQVRGRLAGMEAVSRADIVLLDEPAWSAERMTENARIQLGLSRGRQQGLVNIRLGD